MDIKQVIVMRKDLNMRKGKMAAQAAHASMAVLLDQMKHERYRDPDIHGSYKDETGTILKMRIVDESIMDQWLLTGTFKKICVSVDSEEELLDIFKKAVQNGIPAALITDSGLTEFGGVPTKTCCAIGPETTEMLDPLTGHLKLL